MPVEIKKAESRGDLRRFIYLPEKIHKHHKNWVPPVYMDEWVFYHPKKNPSFHHSDTILFLAWQDKTVVGRIMGIINRKYNEAQQEQHARFFALECYDDFEVARALIDAVLEWARGLGADALVGPLGFSDKDPQGFLIDGFDKPVVISSSCNFPYMVELLERYGFRKKTDLVVYQLAVPREVPPFYKAIAERTLRNKPDLKLIKLHSKKEIKAWVRPVFHLMNETFQSIYAFSEMSEREMDDFAARYMAILDPRFLILLSNEKDGLVAFALGMPDISEGIMRSRGRVFPFGFIHILRSQKKTKQLNLLLGAIKEGYRGNGIDAILGTAMLEAAREGGFELIDSHLELENNLKVRAEMERMGGRVYKRFRIFEYDIDLL